MNLKHYILSLVFFMYASFPVMAHDIWLERINSHSPELVNEVGLFVGHRKNIVESLAIDENKYELLKLANSESNLEQFFKIKNEKLFVGQYSSECKPMKLIMTRPWHRITLPVVKFKEYLVEENHEGLVKTIKSSSDVKERYQRLIKSLFFKCYEGFKREYPSLVSEGNLDLLLESIERKRDGKTLIKMRVILLGLPLKGAVVSAYHDNLPEVVNFSQKSNKDGVVEFLLPIAGNWLIRGVHIQQYTGVLDINYESFWTAYLIEV